MIADPDKLNTAEGITGVILAGGAAKRFGGRIKSKLRVCGEPIISRILNSIEGIFSEIVIVTNTPEEFEEYGHRMIKDQYPGIGPLGGIHAALRAVSGGAIFVLAGDMPLIGRELICRQISLYNKIGAGILTPRAGGFIEPLHSIYNTSLLPVLEEFIIVNHSHAVREFLRLVNVSYFKIDEETASGVFMNINSPGDIIVAEKILQNRVV